MPAYAASADSAQNTLNPHQIEMLTNWLRGEWYEEGPEQGIRDWTFKPELQCIRDGGAGICLPGDNAHRSTQL